jgi:hypothetical protein
MITDHAHASSSLPGRRALTTSSKSSSRSALRSELNAVAKRIGVERRGSIAGVSFNGNSPHSRKHNKVHQNPPRAMTRRPAHQGCGGPVGRAGRPGGLTVAGRRMTTLSGRQAAAARSRGTSRACQQCQHRESSGHMLGACDSVQVADDDALGHMPSHARRRR